MLKFIRQEEFDKRIRCGKSTLICPKVTDSDKPRADDMKGVCDNCQATIFFCKSSEKTKKKLCQDCGGDIMVMNYMKHGRFGVGVK